MAEALLLSNTLDSFIPISRFNKGEAGKIFEEVRHSGYKIVMKNNKPACVMLTPERYQQMMALIENQYLLALAEERLANGTSKTYAAQEIYDQLGIDENDDIPMVYGVDFE